MLQRFLIRDKVDSVVSKVSNSFSNKAGGSRETDNRGFDTYILQTVVNT